jgi:hypothetical protein
VLHLFTPGAICSVLVCVTNWCHCAFPFLLLVLLLQWANMSMTVRGKQYKMLRMHFMPRCKGNSAQ